VAPVFSHVKKYLVLSAIGVALLITIKGSPLYSRTSEGSSGTKTYAHFLMGAVLDGESKFEKALEEYKLALSIDPGSSTI
jgi:hypothetical protein